MTIAAGYDIIYTDFINNSERNSTPANDAGRVVKLESNGLINAGFIDGVKISLGCVSVLDGTPKAVGMTDGTLYTAFSDDTSLALGSKFLGFSRDTLASPNNDFTNLYYAQRSAVDSSYSLTVPAGTNRLLVIAMNIVTDYGESRYITAMTWNGMAMTKRCSSAGVSGGNAGGTFTIWTLPLGDSASPTTANVVLTGTITNTSRTTDIFTLGNIDQNNPVINSFGDGQYSGGVAGSVGGFYKGISGQTLGWGGGQIVSGIGTQYSGSQLSKIAHSPISQEYKAYNTSGGWINRIAFIILKMATSSTTVSSQVSGVVKGFTGLNIGKNYYLSTTIAGGVSETVSGSIIGKAISTTELLLK